MLRRIACAVLLVLAPAILAQEVDVPALAARMLDTETVADPEQRFRLQLVAGRYADALSTLREVGGLANVRWQIYAKAKLIEAEGRPYEEAFRQSFREALGALDDDSAFRVGWSFGTSVQALERVWRDALARNESTAALARAWLGVQVYRSFQPFITGLLEEDRQRRYVVEQDVRVKTSGGATVCAVIVRPRVGDRRLPAILNYMIYANPEGNLQEALRTASNGYAGVVGLVRGKGCSPDQPVPYEHDPVDAAALIDWIDAQQWSDGRVGMYGGSYEGGAAWGAAKRMPKALKGLMTGAPVAPGVDVPMEGSTTSIFRTPSTISSSGRTTTSAATAARSASSGRSQ